MFRAEQQFIEEQIKTFCSENGIPCGAGVETDPFSGEWGYLTSFFATAANEARRPGRR